MADRPTREFGARKPVTIRPAQPVKRGQVALLLMGTIAIGGGAYALMPSENCEPNRPGMAAPSGLQTNSECRPRGSSSSGGHGSSGGSSRSSYFWLVDHTSCGLSIREDENPITGNTSRFLPHAIL